MPRNQSPTCQLLCSLSRSNSGGRSHYEPPAAEVMHMCRLQASLRVFELPQLAYLCRQGFFGHGRKSQAKAARDAITLGGYCNVLRPNPGGLWFHRLDVDVVQEERFARRCDTRLEGDLHSPRDQGFLARKTHLR